jgi:DNA-binding response OmpR family regulator
VDDKILIIEDEVSIAELEKDYLEINGYTVDMAHSGIKGLQMFNEIHYDLVVLDLMLPEIDGFEICKRIREKSEIPILMVSAKKDDIDKIRGLGLGADDYMTKPFSPNELVARVKAHLARFERLTFKEKKKEVNIRNLKIQTEARRVFVDKKEIILTAKEYDLLYFLANNPNMVFSKDVLLDRIWGRDYYIDTATVTVHIGKIRDKIDINGETVASFIETIWGAGYRFNV